MTSVGNLRFSITRLAISAMEALPPRSRMASKVGLNNASKVGTLFKVLSLVIFRVHLKGPNIFLNYPLA